MLHAQPIIATYVYRQDLHSIAEGSTLGEII